jgi:hypothetical protein
MREPREMRVLCGAMWMTNTAGHLLITCVGSQPTLSRRLHTREVMKGESWSVIGLVIREVMKGESCSVIGMVIARGGEGH